MNKEPMLFGTSCCRPTRRSRVPTITAVALHAAWLATAGAADPTPVTVSANEWRAMQEQNRQLRALLESQQRQIDELRRKFDALPAPAEPPVHVSTTIADTPAESPEAPPPPAPTGQRVIISGEVGVAFFAGQDETAFPHDEFRVDDARLFVEAEAARNVYLFSELTLTQRETQDETFHLGECYIEVAGLPAPWGGDDTLTVRAGRIDVPFGEEYQHRDVMANPLISHSVTDFWGIDEGLEVFGRAGRWDYTFAVQNGGHRMLHDFDSDKALVARLGFTPRAGLRTSLSAMRTGDLSRASDQLSEIWIGNGFFRSIGGTTTSTTFRADLAQFDARYDWTGGHLLGAVGRAWYDDDDTAADNRRQFNFQQIEAQQTLAGRLYGAARYSRIEADRGYPLVGHGTFGEYFFTSNFTDHIERFGLGLGYDPAENLRLKVEYTWERGRLTNGEIRDETDQFAAEAGVKF